MKGVEKTARKHIAFALALLICLSMLSACAQQDRSEVDKQPETVSSTPAVETPEPTPAPTPDPRVKIKSSTKFEDVSGTDVSLHDDLRNAFQSLGAYQSNNFATVIESEMLAWVAKADDQHKGDGLFESAVLSPGTRAENDGYLTFGNAVAQYYRNDTDFVNIEMEFQFIEGPGLIYFNKVEVGNMPGWDSVYSYNTDEGPYEYIGQYADSDIPRLANENSMLIWTNMQMAAAKSWGGGYTVEDVPTELTVNEIWVIWTNEMSNLIYTWKKQMNNGVNYKYQIDRTSYNTMFPNFEYSETMVTIKSQVNYWYRFVGGNPAGYVNATVKIDKYTGEIISSYIQ